MMRPTIFVLVLLALTGCGNKQAPEETPGPVTETLSPLLLMEPGVVYEVERSLEEGSLKKEEVVISKPLGGGRSQYTITGPGPVVAKLKALAKGEWLFYALIPKTEEARQFFKTHLHKLVASGGLQKEDIKETAGGWNVVGPREIVQRLMEQAELQQK